MRLIITAISIISFSIGFAQDSKTSSVNFENKINSSVRIQDFYFSFGKSITSYDYRNSKNETNQNLKSSLGNIYEIGLKNLYRIHEVDFDVEIELIDYNSTGNNDTTNFEWNTSYLGFNTLGHQNIKISNAFDIGLDFGIGIQHILSGKQTLGNRVYDLKNNNEFDGLFGNLKLAIGLNTISNNDFNAGLYVGYNKSISLDSNSIEKLNFSSFHIKVKLCTK